MAAKMAALSEEGACDLPKKVEFDELKTSSRHGLDYSAQSECASYTLEELKSIQVIVGPEPGERRVCSSPSYTSGNHKTVGVKETVQVVVTAGANGKEMRQVVVHGPPSADRKCAFCDYRASFRCSLCTTTYCSEVCQVKDWPAHRPVCDQKGKGLAASPQGEPVEEDKCDALSPEPSGHKRNPRTGPGVICVRGRKLPSPDCLMLPVWRTPDVLYLHQESLHLELEAMNNTLNAWVTSVCKLTYDCYSKGDYVCALFSKDSTWYRGQVMKECPEDKYTVLFIDYGNSEELGAESLRPLPLHVGVVPRFAFPVVPQGGMSARLVSLLDRETSVRVVQLDTAANQSLPVVRLERADGSCLNDLLQDEPKVAAGDSQASQQGGAEKPPKRAPQPLVVVPDCPLPAAFFEAFISAVEGNTVYLQPVARREALAKIVEALADGTPFDDAVSSPPLLGQCVLALYPEDQLWYRARIISMDERASTVEVLFVDYGNTAYVSGACLLPMTEELAREAACAMPALLDAVPLLSARAGDILPKELLTVQVTNSSWPPRTRLLLDGKCVNGMAAHKDEPTCPTGKQEEASRGRAQETVRIKGGQLPEGLVQATMVAREGNFVYLCTVPDRDKLALLKAHLETHAATSSPCEEVSVGDTVCTLGEDETWHRATVTGMAGDLCKLFLVDAGTTEVVRRKELRCLPRDLACCGPSLALKVQLDGVVGRLTDALVGPFMKTVVTVVEVTAERGSGPPSVLMFSLSGECVNKTLRTRMMKWVHKSAFEERALPTGRIKVVVSHVSDIGQLFYLQQPRLAPALEMMMAELNADEPAALESQIALGDGVCARYPADGRWHRAVVMSIPEDGECRLKFADFGYSEVVPVGNIRALPEQMKDIPLFAVCVGLKGVKSVSKDCKAELRNREFDAEIVDTDRLPIQVKLFVRGKSVNRFIQ